MSKIQGRATPRQIEALVSFLEHPEMASGKFHTMNSSQIQRENWEQLASQLNSLVPSGKEKDVKSWKIVSIKFIKYCFSL